jgi:hypothetical protein
VLAFDHSDQARLLMSLGWHLHCSAAGWNQLSLLIFSKLAVGATWHQRW